MFRLHIIILQYALEVLGSRIPLALQSGATEIQRGLSSGTVSFGTEKEMWPVSQPMPKISAKLQVVSDYISDITTAIIRLCLQIIC